LSVGLAINVQGGDVTAYGLVKVRSLFQVGSMPPTELGATYDFNAFVVMSRDDAVSEATLELPNGDVAGLLQEDNSRYMSIEEQYNSEAALDASYPNGEYTLTITGTTDGQRAVKVNLVGDTYPGATTVSDYQSLQAVNPAAPLNLSWSAFAGGTVDDFIEVQIDDLMQGEDVFATPPPWEPKALNGTSTSVTVPANTLSANSMFMLTVTLMKGISKDTTSYPGATGYVAFGTETRLFIRTTAAGPSDTTPPALVMSRPADKATGVPLNWAINFTFSEPMTTTLPANAVTWSANVGSVDLTPLWHVDAQTVCFTHVKDLPAHTTITWQLNAAAFKDKAGNPMAANVSGSFTTGDAPVADPCCPCGEGEESGTGALGIARDVVYTQTGSNAPQPKSPMPAFFVAFLTTPTNNVVISAELQEPDGTTLTLTNLFGRSFMCAEEFPSEAGLNAAHPFGNYTLKVARTNGERPTITLNIPDAWPPTPQILNLPALQSVNPDSDFTVQWSPFTGATYLDTITLVIERDATVFVAPDPCVPRPLPNTATSIVVPKGILEPGLTYQGTLTFQRLAVLNTNAIPDIPAVASLTKRVEFELRTTSAGGPPAPAKFTAFAFLPNGHMFLQFTGQAGRTYTLESSLDLKQWTSIKTQTAPSSGLMEYEDPLSGAPQASYYRVTGH
jgi:hypothetical protein